MSLRVIYFGLLGEFSLLPLLALFEAGLDVRGVFVTAPRSADDAIRPLEPAARPSDVPIVDPFLERSIVHVAWERGVPAFAVGQLEHRDTAAALAALQPDVACVACFSRRIPSSMLSLPRFGFLNLHPSLLPAYRGPEPLFWTFRDGVTSTGVTVHFMDEGLDTGDIARQAPVELPDGVSGAKASRLCAQVGGQLMAQAAHALAHGALPRRPQPDDEGGYYPSPRPGDFLLSATWPARRAFNFMRGTAEWGRAYALQIDGRRLSLRSALSYSADQTLDAPLVQSAAEAWIQFAPGVLRARTA